MHTGRKNRKYTYRMEDKILDEAEEENDLGVWLKNNLKPEKQVATAVNKAMATLRSITDCLQTTIRKLSISPTGHMGDHTLSIVCRLGPLILKKTSEV